MKSYTIKIHNGNTSIERNVIIEDAGYIRHMIRNTYGQYLPFEIIKETPVVHLQYVGEVEAKPAQDFVIGEKMMWNYGCTTEIVSKKEVSSCYLMFGIIENGKHYERKLKKDRLVAIG